VTRAIRVLVADDERNLRELVVRELRERTGVSRRVDDDLLPLEGGIEVRHDANAPAGGVGTSRAVRHGEALRRRPVLPPFAERALVELRVGGRLDQSRGRARAPAAVRRNGDQAAGERIPPQVGQLEPPFPFGRSDSTNVLRMSTGAGKTIVVDWDEPSSSKVCR